MKNKVVLRKLRLNKMTIANLEKMEMIGALGGGDSFVCPTIKVSRTCTDCPPPDDPTSLNAGCTEDCAALV